MAYPHLASNPIHQALPALAQLAQVHWDDGNDFFPPTSFQIANFFSGTGASNVIPGECKIQFNLRFSTEITDEMIRQTVHRILDQHGLSYQLDWVLSGQPFLTESGHLLDASIQAIQKITDITPELLTSGGTSDGRFIAKMGGQVIELGPVNATIHKVNECVKVADLETLTRIYQQTLENLLAS